MKTEILISSNDKTYNDFMRNLELNQAGILLDGEHKGAIIYRGEYNWVIINHEGIIIWDLEAKVNNRVEIIKRIEISLKI